MEVRFVLYYLGIECKLRDTENFCRDIDDRGLPRRIRLGIDEGFEVETAKVSCVVNILGGNIDNFQLHTSSEQLHPHPQPYRLS